MFIPHASAYADENNDDEQSISLSDDSKSESTCPNGDCGKKESTCPNGDCGKKNSKSGWGFSNDNEDVNDEEPTCVNGDCGKKNSNSGAWGRIKEIKIEDDSASPNGDYAKKDIKSRELSEDEINELTKKVEGFKDGRGTIDDLRVALEGFISELS